jgi:predicted membrane-bound dolichyl-phosphate-mannose-protein mannosyltransferase
MASIVQFSQLERWTSLTLPTKSYIKPIEIFPGTGMIIIVAFEYNDTSIGSYNEIGLAVAVKFPPKFIFPGLSAISMMRKNCFSVYIHHLLVEAI